jgi:predicted dehydrogenase
VAASRPDEVRWGILGAARIAATAFLPGLSEAGGGRPALVGARDLPRAEAWAAHHGVDRAVAGYEAVVDAPDIDAIYVALPNAHHAVWTQRALRAGKAVLCEKPLCADPIETAAVLETAVQSGSWLWEAFVFPFSVQQRRLLELVEKGAIGEVGEVQSTFHFVLSRPGDIRLSADLGGGALADLGCYPVHCAHALLPAAGPPVVSGVATFEGSVETEATAVVAYGPRRLVLSCGFRLARDTETRVLGTEGRIHLTNAFHPRPADTLTIVRPGVEPAVERLTTNLWTFGPALDHIHGVLRRGKAPEHLAVDSSLRTAEVVQAVRDAVLA